MEKFIECMYCSEIFYDGRMVEVKIKNLLTREYYPVYYCDNCFKKKMQKNRGRNNE